MTALGWTAVFAALTAAVPNREAPAGGALEQLHGSWEITAMVLGGLPTPPADFAGLRVEIRDDRLTVVPPATGEGALSPGSYACTIDPTKSPGLIDLTALDGPFKGKVFAGLYDLRGDVLRSCTPTTPDLPRPRSFEPPPNPPYLFLTLRRAR